VNLVGKPDAGNPPVRFDEGDQAYTLVPTLPESASGSGSSAAHQAARNGSRRASLQVAFRDA